MRRSNLYCRGLTINIQRSTVNSQQLTANRQPPVGVAGNGAELDADALLQASRRLDWRFLLPDPELGHVACLGVVAAELQDSMRLFSESLTVLALEEKQNGEMGQFDVVVLRHLSSEKLELAAEWLKPGGYLYAENDGYLSGGKHWRFAVPSACVTAVSQAGFTEVQAHWHWPNFAACTRIIPLDDRDALRFSFVRGGRSAKARLQSGFGRLLLWSGLLKQVVPRFSIIAQLDSL